MSANRITIGRLGRSESGATMFLWLQPSAATERVEDDDAFIAAIEQHKKLLYKIARLYSDNAADRQDLTQDMIVALWQSYPRFDGRSKWSTWMYRVCLNVAISWQRDHRRRRVRHHDSDQLVLDAVPAPINERQAQIELIQQLLVHLPEMDRALVLLHLEGQEHDEIAEILNISSSNVATKLGRIKQKLQQHLALS